MSPKIWSAGILIAVLGTPALGHGQTRAAYDVITAVGCVQREADYRAQVADNKGGIANTGVGVGNEFVLRDTHTVSSENLKPIRNTATGGIETIYSLTGKLEHEIANAAGAKIAVSGYVEVAPSDGTKRVKDLPRFNVIGWHKVSSSCRVRKPDK